MSPTRVRKPRVLPTSHQSRIDHAQAHSQQWSLWKPGSQEGACGAGAWEEGLARVSPQTLVVPCGEEPAPLCGIRAIYSPIPVPSVKIFLPSSVQALSYPLKLASPSPLPARRSESVSGVPGSRAGQASPPRGLWLELLQRKPPTSLPPSSFIASCPPGILVLYLPARSGLFPTGPMTCMSLGPHQRDPCSGLTPPAQPATFCRGVPGQDRLLPGLQGSGKHSLLGPIIHMTPA